MSPELVRCVLMDIQMPGMSGLDVLRVLAADTTAAVSGVADVDSWVCAADRVRTAP